MSLTPRPPPPSIHDVVVVDDKKINELANKVRSCHMATLKAGTDMVEQAIATGDAILEARTVVPRGEWLVWVKENVRLSVSTVYNYEALAMGQEVIRTGLRMGEPLYSITACLRLLNPPTTSPQARRRPPDQIEHAQAMRKKAAFDRVEIDDDMVQRTAQWFREKFPHTFERMTEKRRKTVSEEWAASVLVHIFMKNTKP